MDTSVSTWIALLKAGQKQAVPKLWDRFFPRLVLLARDKLRGLSQGDADEEDIALSAFHAFYRAATSGRVPDLTNRDDLWRTLVLITTAKAVDRRRYQQAQKRGGAGAAQEERALMDEVVGEEPDPALAALLADECQTLLRRLNDDELRQMALLRLEGHTTEEIANRLDCSLRTVKRRLALIRRSWEAMAAGAGA